MSDLMIKGLKYFAIAILCVMAVKQVGYIKKQPGKAIEYITLILIVLCVFALVIFANDLLIWTNAA